MAEIPNGTVTFLFTDIEGSTALAQQFPADLPILLAQHHAILHQAIEAYQGHVFQITGDAFCAAFHTASDALQAALVAQRGLQHGAWHPAPIKVRMGIHTGAAEAGAIEELAWPALLTVVQKPRIGTNIPTRLNPGCGMSGPSNNATSRCATRCAGYKACALARKTWI